MNGNDHGEPLWPIFTMRDWYVAHNEGGEEAFDIDLRAYLTNGYVYSGPDLFVMARLIPHDLPDIGLDNPYARFDNADCWYVHASAGRIGRVFELMPVSVKYARWIKHGKHFTIELTRIKDWLTKRR